MSAGARVFGENLTLGCHDGEISLSGSPGQFSSIERERCPTPAVKEPMESFKPRTLTESVVRRFFLKHNKSKLENPGFITNLMKRTDDEIRSTCKARYHASPEPVHDDFDIKAHRAQQVPGALLRHAGADVGTNGVVSTNGSPPRSPHTDTCT